jgi:hypothetical protein
MASVDGRAIGSGRQGPLKLNGRLHRKFQTWGLSITRDHAWYGQMSVII